MRFDLLVTATTIAVQHRQSDLCSSFDGNNRTYGVSGEVNGLFFFLCVCSTFLNPGPAEERSPIEF